MGVWLLVFEKRRMCGAIAIVAGIAWFLIATQVIIPAFRPAGVEATLRYAYLGDSVLDIARNLFLKPQLVLGRVFSPATLEYLLLLVAPLLWGLSLQNLTPLIPALPMLVINILSESPTQRDLVHQYSLPILPFLLLTVIATFAVNKFWLKRRWVILLCSLVAFLALAKYGYFGSLYLKSLDTWSATSEAVSQVQAKGSVLTTHNVVPHLTHRSQIRFTLANEPLPDLTQFHYVLLDTRHPGWMSNTEFANRLVNLLRQDSRFQLGYQRNDVYLFAQK
jgi:uncharacterized membrane protein